MSRELRFRAVLYRLQVRGIPWPTVRFMANAPYRRDGPRQTGNGSEPNDTVCMDSYNSAPAALLPRPGWSLMCRIERKSLFPFFLSLSLRSSFPLADTRYVYFASNAETGGHRCFSRTMEQYLVPRGNGNIFNNRYAPRARYGGRRDGSSRFVLSDVDYALMEYYRYASGTVMPNGACIYTIKFYASNIVTRETNF